MTSRSIESKIVWDTYDRALTDDLWSPTLTNIDQSLIKHLLRQKKLVTTAYFTCFYRQRHTAGERHLSSQHFIVRTGGDVLYFIHIGLMLMRSSLSGLPAQTFEQVAMCSLNIYTMGLQNYHC